MASLRSISEDLRHPEVELRMKGTRDEWGYPEKDFITSFDLLEVYSDSGGKVIIKEEMEQADIAEYSNSTDFEGPKAPMLRVFFIEEPYISPPLRMYTSSESKSSLTTPSNRNGRDTALLMHKKFGVPMLFFRDQPPSIGFATSGNVTFLRRNEEGIKQSLDGYYQFCSEYRNDKPGYVWFSRSFNPKTRPSTYIVHNASTATKSLIFDCAQGSNWLSLTRPFAIDAFIMNDWIIQMNNEVGNQFSRFVPMEYAVVSFREHELHLLGQNVKDKHTLYVLAREFRFMKNNLHSLKVTLDYLLKALKKVDDASTSGQRTAESDRGSIHSSLMLLKSKANWTASELSGLEDRAKLLIDLVNNLPANQHSPAILDRVRAGYQGSPVAPSLQQRVIRRSYRLWRKFLRPILQCYTYNFQHEI